MPISHNKNPRKLKWRQNKKMFIFNDGESISRTSLKMNDKFVLSILQILKSNAVDAVSFHFLYHENVSCKLLN